MKGFIYVLSNPSLSSVKIGKTKADPTQRTKDLTGSTSIPTAFKLEYSAYVDDYNAKEREIHLALDAHRVNSKREFFDVTVAKAISTVEDICLIRYAENLAIETITRQKKEVALEVETARSSSSYLGQIMSEGNGLVRGSFPYPMVPLYEKNIRGGLFVLLALPALLIFIIIVAAGLAVIYDNPEGTQIFVGFAILLLLALLIYVWLVLCGWLLQVDFSKLRRPKTTQKPQGT